MPHLAGESFFLGAPSPTDLEHYKAIALAAGKAGKTPGQVRALIKQQIVTDLTQHAAKTGTSFTQHLATLKAQTTPVAGVSGFDLFRDVSHAVSDVAKAEKDIEHVANDVVKKVSPILKAVGKFAGNIPWGDIVHDVEGAIATVPGLGTVVSEAIAFGESAYDSAVALAHHNPIEAAIDAAYNAAIAAAPGAGFLRHILDPVKAVLIGLTVKHEPVGDSILDGVLTNVPDKPRFGKISPRSVAGTLAQLIVKKIGVKKHGGPKVPPTQAMTAAHEEIRRQAALPAPATAALHAEIRRQVAPSAPTPPVPPAPPVGHRPHRPHAAQGKYAPYPR